MAHRRATAVVMSVVLGCAAIACVPPAPTAPTTSTSTSTTVTAPGPLTYTDVTTWLGHPGECATVDGDRTSGRFRAPSGIAADPSGNLLVADGLDHVIRRVDPAGSVTTLAGTVGVGGVADGTGPTAQIDVPSFTMGVDGLGALFFGEQHEKLIRRVDPDGTVTTVAGGPVPSDGAYWRFEGPAADVHFFFPIGVTVDGTAVVISDTSTKSVRALSAGVVTVLWGGLEPIAPTVGTGDFPFSGPMSVAVGADGDFWVHDGGSAVYRLDRSGNMTLLAGTPGEQGSRDGLGTEARFEDLAGMAIGPDGSAYIAGDDVIRKVTPGGSVTTLAGVAGERGSADGSGGAARFDGVSSLAFGSDGALYATDIGNCAVRRLT